MCVGSRHCKAAQFTHPQSERKFSVFSLVKRYRLLAFTGNNGHKGRLEAGCNKTRETGRNWQMTDGGKNGEKQSWQKKFQALWMFSKSALEKCTENPWWERKWTFPTQQQKVNLHVFSSLEFDSSCGFLLLICLAWSCWRTTYFWQNNEGAKLYKNELVFSPDF